MKQPTREKGEKEVEKVFFSFFLFIFSPFFFPKGDLHFFCQKN